MRWDSKRKFLSEMGTGAGDAVIGKLQPEELFSVHLPLSSIDEGWKIVFKYFHLEELWNFYQYSQPFPQNI